MDEFAVIARYFTPVKNHAQSVLVGVGDDCALLNPPAGQQLVSSIDTLVEGVHFLPDTAADRLAWRLLGAAVSDLAAMGATPLWLSLSVTLPAVNESWLEAFSRELHRAVDKYALVLIGGDTSRGPLSLTAQVTGAVPPGRAMLRTGARVGDIVYVTGSLGDSRAGLALQQQEELPALDEDSRSYLLGRFFAPTPRWHEGELIRDLASSCIDISDGLLADLSHLLAASEAGAVLNLDALPLSAALQQAFPEHARDWALAGGEDFELCFTLPEHKVPVLESRLQLLSTPVTPVGVIVDQPGIRVRENNQVPYSIEPAGYRHF